LYGSVTASNSGLHFRHLSINRPSQKKSTQ
jgi:hypothetical protein